MRLYRRTTKDVRVSQSMKTVYQFVPKDDVERIVCHMPLTRPFKCISQGLNRQPKFFS